MNSSNHSSDAVMKTLKTRAIVRGIAGVLVVFGIIVVAGSHEPSSNELPTAATSKMAPSSAADASLDAQLRIDPSEIMFYSSNVHG